MFFKLLKLILLINLCESINLDLLPETSRPIHYELQIGVSVPEKTFSGTVVLNLEILKPTKEIFLNSENLYIDYTKVVLKNHLGQEFQLKSYNETLHEIVIFEFSDIMKIGKYNLTMDFSGSISDNLKGLYISRYFKDGVERNIATTFFAPNYARFVFPCYDEPQHKATFSLTIFHSSEFMALSNMPVIDSRKIPYTNNLKMTAFDKSPPMSTYIFAFVVSDFVENKNSYGNFSVYSQDNVRDHTYLPLEFGQQSLKAIETYLNSNYQLKKMDFIAIDDFLMGAMENWGIVTYKSSKLLFDKDETNTKSYQHIFNIISHELSHQWFGNEVTCSWWSHTWLNEGFASFFEFFATSILKPEWKLMDQFVVLNFQYALSLDCNPNSRSMNSEILTTEQLSSIYDFVSYRKAASIIRMIQHIVKPENFQLALQNYIKHRSHNSSTPNDLYYNFDNILTEQKFSIKEIFSSWADNPGYPVINVIRNYENGVIEITQEQFTTNGKAQAKTSNEFYIPLNYATELNQDFKSTKPTHWLTPNNTTLTLDIENIEKSSWIIFNKKQTGYYRVNYDEKNWKSVIEQLKLKKIDAIDPINRAQLIDDSYNLAKYDYLSFNVTLDLLSYIKREHELIPFMSAIPVLEFLLTILKGHAKYHLLMDYTHNLIQKPFQNVENMNINEIDHVKKLLRMDIYRFACKYGLPDCYKKSKSKKYDIDLRSTGFCIEAKSLSVASKMDKPSILTRFEKITSSNSERHQHFDELYEIIDAMSCTQNVDYIKSFLNTSLNTELYLEKDDRQKIFISILQGNYNGTKYALDFLKDNYAKIQENYTSVPAIWTAIGSSIVSQDLHNHFLQIIQENKDLITPEENTSIELAIKLLNTHMNWLDNQGAEIINWIEHVFFNENNVLVVDDDDNDMDDNGSSRVLSMQRTLFVLISFILWKNFI